MPSLSRSHREDQPPIYEEDADEFANTLQSAASTRKAVPKDEVADAVDRLSQHASIRGLSSGVLDILIDTLTKAPCYLDQSTAGRIVKCLIPRRKVSEDVVIKIVGCLGQGPKKPSPGVQASLLRWLVMVYDVLENYNVLSQLYGILFNLLDMISLRPYLCHLLSSLTKRAHVKPFRIQALLELRRSIGKEQPLNALLQVYKTYYPDVIVENVGAFKRGIFSHPDPEWMQQLLTIHESNSINDAEQRGKSSFRVARRIEGPASKRRRTDVVVVPAVQTYRAIESSFTLEEVQNANDFVEKLHKLELPNQLAAVLDSTLLQRLLALRPSATSADRINNWLAAKLDDILQLANSPPAGFHKRTDELLSKIVRYTRSSRLLLPAVHDFLKSFLRTWDGKTHRESILGLACFLPLEEFDELHVTFLKPIENASMKNDDAAASKLLECYTELLRNWSVTYSNRLPDNEDLTVESSSLRKFQKHCGDVCLELHTTFTPSPILTNAILSYYELSSCLPWENTLFYMILPPDQLVYHCVFSGDASTLTRICGVLYNYKTAFDISIRIHGSDTGGYSQEHIGHFNGFLMDICNCLWRNRAFNQEGVQDPQAMGCNIPESVISSLQSAAAARSEHLRSLFSFSASAVLALFSAERFRALEDAAVPTVAVKHSGPVSQNSLKALAAGGGLRITWMDYRIAVINDLKQRGLTGMGEFLYSTMISLKGRS